MFGFCVGDVKGCAKCGALGINSFNFDKNLLKQYSCQCHVKFKETWTQRFSDLTEITQLARRRTRISSQILSSLFPTFSHDALGFPGGTVVKNPPANAEDAGDRASIPGSGRFPGVGNGNLFQYSCLENAIAQRSQAGYSLWSHRVGHD